MGQHSKMKGPLPEPISWLQDLESFVRSQIETKKIKVCNIKVIEGSPGLGFVAEIVMQNIEEQYLFGYTTLQTLTAISHWLQTFYEKIILSNGRFSAYIKMNYGENTLPALKLQILATF